MPKVLVIKPFWEPMRITLADDSALAEAFNNGMHL
jgi:hypothetical protein